MRSIFIKLDTTVFGLCRYKHVVAKLMHARMLFFDTTPTGRILNHVSSDTQRIDEDTPQVHVNYYVCSIRIKTILMCENKLTSERDACSYGQDSR